MNREIVVTQDGSHSIHLPDINVTYHSKFGAMQESMHVFISAGLQYAAARLAAPGPLCIFELGFGTGLNALLTAAETERAGLQVYYETVEPFPLNMAEAGQLNYCGQLQRTDLKPLFEQLHQSDWNRETTLAPHFMLRKWSSSLQDWLNSKTATAGGRPGINIIYFDAFAPEVQPELWTSGIFGSLYPLVAPQGVLVTYCSKTEVRRALQAAGFTVEKIPGPRGKREMLRAIKSE